MSYPDFPPDPYDDRRDRRSSSSRPGRSRDEGRGDRDGGRSRGAGGYGSRGSRGGGRGAAGDGGYRSRDGWGRGDGSRGDSPSGWGGSGSRAEGDGGSRGRYEGRGSSNGGGRGRYRDDSRGYSRDSGGDDRGRHGGSGRGWQSSRSWPGASERAGYGGRRGGRGYGDDPERGGRGDSWGGTPGSASRGWGRGVDREPAAHWSEGREQWARRGATALRDRYRDATDWFTVQQGGVRGLAARIPFLSRFGGGGGGWDGPGPRPRRKGDWWRHWTWRKATGVIASAFGVFGVIGAILVAYEYSVTQIPPISSASLSQSSTVYFSDGKTVVGRFGSTNRVDLTSYSQIPPVVVDSFLAAEDNNFFHEGGISPTGIARAAIDDVLHPNGGLQGGSTITQELVRNYYSDVGFAQTFDRKIKEIFIAEKIAQTYSKQWVLLKYLNTINFGSGTYGLGAAAQLYFHIPVNQLSRLTPAQAALLTALPNDPNYFSLDPKAGQPYQQLVARWQYVLQSMEKDGYLTAQQLAQEKFPKTYPPINNDWNGVTGYIMMAVQRELEGTYHYSSSTIENGGLSITTTFNKKLTADLYSTVSRERKMMKHDQSNVYPLTAQSAFYGTPTQLPRYVNIGAVLENPHTGGIEAMYSGQNYNANNYDMALQSRNQVGSSFKPYVLSAAVAEGMNAQTSILDGESPVYVPPVWEPMIHSSMTKHSGSWYGPIINDEVVQNQGQVSVTKATAESLNSAFTDLYHRVALPNGTSGPNEIANIAQKFGVNIGPYPSGSGLAGMDQEVGVALGQPSLTVEEQATMIATLADNGVYHAPHVIKSITDGNVVKQAHPATHQVLTAEQAAQVDSALEHDTDLNLGTAPAMGLKNGQVIIAKTGTTNLSQQAFFLGATPHQAMAVGMFVNNSACPKGYQSKCESTSSLKYDPNIPGLETLFGVGAEAGYGGQWPAYLWHLYFNKEFNNEPVVPWPAANSTYGSKWVLLNLPKPKPPKPKKPVLPPGACGGHGRHALPCPSSSPTQPLPSPSATISSCVSLPGSPCPSASPTASPGTTAGTKLATTASTSGSALAGTVLFGGVVAVATPARRRRRRLRRR